MLLCLGTVFDVDMGSCFATLGTKTYTSARTPMFMTHVSFCQNPFSPPNNISMLSSERPKLKTFKLTEAVGPYCVIGNKNRPNLQHTMSRAILRGGNLKKSITDNSLLLALLASLLARSLLVVSRLAMHLTDPTSPSTTCPTSPSTTCPGSVLVLELTRADRIEGSS